MKLQRLPRSISRPVVVAALLAAFPLAAADSANTPVDTPVAVSSTPGSTPVPEVLSKLPAALQAQHLATLKTRGDTEISRRLKNLNDASSKIAGLTSLSAADKATLTTQVQNEISGLTALKAKIDADTTLAVARTDVQSIVTEYRVYLLMLPKVHLVTAADRLTSAASNLSAMQPKLQAAIDKQKAAGKDVTAMQAELQDMEAKLTTANTALSGVSAKLLALVPGDYNANHTVLMQYRSGLGTAQSSVSAARNDAAGIIKALGGKAVPSPSPSASAVSTATPAAH